MMASRVIALRGNLENFIEDGTAEPGDWSNKKTDLLVEDLLSFCVLHGAERETMQRLMEHDPSTLRINTKRQHCQKDVDNLQIEIVDRAVDQEQALLIRELRLRASPTSRQTNKEEILRW